MANYLFLMQFGNDTWVSAEEELRMRVISEIGSGLSMIGCVMTLSLLCFLPTKGDGLFIVGNMCVVLMAAQLSFLGRENTSYPDPVMCKVATSLLHYLFLCVHCASLSYAIHLWFKVKSGHLPTSRRKGLYVTLIWVLPLIVVAITVMARGDIYAKSNSCWLPSTNQTRLAFLLPLGVILLINWTLFTLILAFRIKHELSNQLDLCTIFRHAVLASLSMVPVLSLNWTLGYSVTFDLPIGLQYIYVALSSSQGMLLLVFHVLTNGQIRTGLCQKAPEQQKLEETPSISDALTFSSAIHDRQKKQRDTE